MKKEMLINVLQPEECRIAIVEDGVLEELYVERTSLESYTGNIYKGKVVNLEPAIQAAFVDFSVGRNGFLHVSDVEPQYYDRHQQADDPRDRDRDRDARRDRPDPRRPRPDDRDLGGPPPSARGEDRPRDRPDRSERGRRDRSQPRRFGEGLIGDEEPKPSVTARAAEPPREQPPRLDRDEPARTRSEAATWAEEKLFGRPAEREREREARPAEREREVRPVEREREARPAFGSEEPRGRNAREAEPFDPDLPPSRTERARTQPAPPRAAEFDDEDVDVSRSRLPAAFGPEPVAEPPASRERDRDRDREPRRGRGRGQSSSRPPAEPERAFGPAEPFEPETEAAPAEPIEPEYDPRTEPTRRRGGRAAIRSRGGEREFEAPRARPVEREPEAPRARPVDPEPVRAREPRPVDPETFRPRDPRPVEPEPESRPRPAADRDRGRAVEPDRDRDRDRDRKAHDRAGEPGYVPRRERSRSPEPAFGGEASPASPDWAEFGPESENDLDDEGTGESGTEETAGAGGKLDGPRRRRRRRGRRRERDRPGLPGDATNPATAGDLDADLEDDDLEETPASAGPAPLLPRGAKAVVADDDDLDREFDFGDEQDVHDRYDEEDGHDDLRQGSAEGDETATASAEDDGIDPGLEEEIRREIEEIAELEREMGLRGTTEARPRRGDDRETEPGPRGSGGRSARGRGMSKPPIQEIFRRGDEVLVQVIKESIGTKGPTLSTYISIPGRYLVLMPGLNRVGVSRKIADEGQRRKLRDIMNDLNPPKGLGFIVRTAGLERSKRELARDLAYLLRLWKVILRRIKKAKAPAAIYQESDMITRTIRDIFTSEIDTIWIDEPQAFERAQEFLRVVMPRFVTRLKLYDERVPLFHKYGIEDEIAKIQRRRIDLPEGGSIVIDQTEALVAIDVNSGNFRVENDAERTAYEMNLRAAKEIARQLRLRDLGGVIVNDFIDMRDERHRRGVEKALRDAIKRDRARTKVLRMSAFGLIEMTRQRIRPSLKRSVYEDCRNCTGGGVVKTVESMSIDVMRLLALASHREDIRRVNISVSTPVATYLNNRKRVELTRLETEYHMTIHIRPEEDVAAEHLQVECFDGNNGEVRILPPPPLPGNRRPHGR